MKNCLICQTGQDRVALNRIPVSLEGAHWGDFLICSGCLQALGADQVKALIRAAVEEKSFEPANVLLAGEAEAPEAEPGTLDLPVSAALLKDPAAFARFVGEKVGAKLWELHRRGPSGGRLATALSPDGEGGYIFTAEYAPAPKA